MTEFDIRSPWPGTTADALWLIVWLREHGVCRPWFAAAEVTNLPHAWSFHTGQRVEVCCEPESQCFTGIMRWKLKARANIAPVVGDPRRYSPGLHACDAVVIVGQVPGTVDEYLRRWPAVVVIGPYNLDTTDATEVSRYRVTEKLREVRLCDDEPEKAGRVIALWRQKND